jgi:hypothetical protein
MPVSFLQANFDLNTDYGGATPATIYAALTTSAPTFTGGGTIVEPTNAQYNGYARVAIANNHTNWPAAANGSISNGIQIIFPVAGSGSVNNTPLTHLVFMTASSGGNIMDALALPSGTVIITGQALSFQIGSVIISES